MVHISFRTTRKLGTALLAVASFASAAEPTATAARESALESARRELEALDFSNLSVSSGGSLKLQRPLPPLETAPDDHRILSPIQRARNTASDAAEKKSAPSKTWLLDALGDANAPARGLDGMSFADDLEQPTIGSGNNGQRSSRNNPDRRTHATPEDEPRHAPDEQAPTVVRNPLDAYMSKWMTARDFELLRSRPDGMNGRTASAILPAISASAFVSPAPLLFSEVNIIASSIRLDDPRLTGIRENPYLQAFRPPTFQNPPSQMPVAPVQSSSTLTRLPETRAPLVNEVENPHPQPSFAEQLKAQDDARFFKQLKRF